MDFRFHDGHTSALMADIQVVQSFLAALRARDIPTALSKWSPGARWHILGRHSFAGDYSSEEYLQLIKRWYEDYPEYEATPTDAKAYAGGLVVLHMQTRRGAAPGETFGLLVYRIVDGLIDEGWAITASARGEYPF